MSDPAKTSSAAVPLALLAVFAAVAAGLQLSEARSRESLLPAMRVIQQQGKGLERAAAQALPLTPEQERAEGERLNARLSPRPFSPALEPLRGLVAELGVEASRGPLVRRFPSRYVFDVYDSRSPNAFALPGGFVHVSSALVERLRGRDDQLLFVLGHEIGHVELGHCADGSRLQAYGRELGLGGLGELAGVMRTLAALSFSESQELEADAFAVRLLAEKGRDPRAGLGAFDALGLTEARERRDPLEAPGEALTDYFRTHPGAWERRARVRAEIGLAARGR